MTGFVFTAIPLTVAIWAAYDLRKLRMRFKGQEVERKLRSAVIMFAAGQTEQGNAHLDDIIKSMRDI